jgi:hypothetical protein
MSKQRVTISNKLFEIPQFMTHENWRLIAHKAEEKKTINEIVDVLVDTAQQKNSQPDFCIFPFASGTNMSGLNIICLTLRSGARDRTGEKITFN